MANGYMKRCSTSNHQANANQNYNKILLIPYTCQYSYCQKTECEDVEKVIPVILLLLLLSCFSRVRLCATPQTAAHQALLSLGFSRQEHWSKLPFPSLLVQPLQKTVKRTPISSVQSLSCVQLCDLMNCSMPGLPVHHQLPEFTQTHVHRVSDAIQRTHPLSCPSPPAPNPSQHQSLFQ